MKLQKTVAIVCCLANISACSIFPPRNFPDGLGADCKTVDCVMEAVDSIADDPKWEGTRFEWMEGYEDNNLTKMYADGRLEISEMPVVIPLALLSVGVLFFGLSYIQAGKYGEMWKCNIYYTDFPNNHFLIHELMHCQGYKDYGFINGNGSYTKDQLAIMKIEGKDKWVDTNFYKQKLYITEDYIANKSDK